MSGLFGGSHSQSQSPTRYNGIQISSSSSGNCVPLLYGRQRVPFNLMWYGNFSSKPVNSSGGGKGGGSSQPTSYTYSASFAAGLCEGPIAGIDSVWNDKDLTSLSALGMTLFTGAGGQAAWSYLTSNFPTQAVPYDHTCYVAVPGYVFGDSASMPNITFEVQGLILESATELTFTGNVAANAVSATMTSKQIADGIWNITFSDDEVRSCSVSGNTIQWSGGLSYPVTNIAYAGCAYDCDPADIIKDYLTDPNHGVGFPTSKIATLTGANSFSSYCRSLGLTLSLFETTQRASSDCIKEILQITNADAVWSAGTLKIIPYADAAVAGNGYSYTPDLTPEFIFTDDDFLEKPEIDRIATAETFNHVRIEYLDRSNDYNTAVAEATDIGDIALTGERIMDTLSFHEITNSTTARIAAQLILQTSLYERNTIKFKVRADYCLLEPMDYIGICDPIKADGSGLGYGTISSTGIALTGQVFRVTKITDDDKDTIEIEAMEIPGTVRSAATYDWQGVAGYNANFADAPGNVQAPAFVEIYGNLVSAVGGRNLFIAVAGTSNNAAWGGCDVFMSFDNVTYDPIGMLTSPSRYGVTIDAISAAADPDTGSTLEIQLNDTTAVLGTGSRADADNDRMLIAVGSSADSTEVMSYQTATLVAAGAYNITYLRRGQYSTPISAHASGVQFMRLDGNVLVLPVDPGWLGQTLYFKFCSFNQVGRAIQNISAVTEYSYTVGDASIAYNGVTDSIFSVTGPAVVYSPTTAFKQTTAGAAWNASVYAAQSFTNGCSATLYPSQILPGTSGGGFMFGLTYDPTVSPSYTNIAYAFCCSGSGVIYIYESGTDIGTYGDYTTSTLFQITHDGKHVAYYINGNLVRSVAVATNTFFMQISFFTPGAAVYGMAFDNVATAVTPFTMLPLSTGVACVGTRAASVSGANGYAIRGYTSKETYANGAQISFSVGQTGGALWLGLSGYNTASSPYSNIFAGWYPHGAGGVCELIYNGATLTGSGIVVSRSPLLTDVFTITYDNFTITWFLNGAVIHQEYYTGAAPLYLFGDFYNVGLDVLDISFGPYGQLSPNPFVATGTAVTHDSTAIKGAGADAWDSAVYSINRYGICHAQAKTGDVTQQWMIGLTAMPLASSSYTNLAYAWSCDGNANEWQIYESGSLIGAYGSAPTITDLVGITYDGTHVRYYLNNQLMRTSAISGQDYYFSSSLYSVGANITSISFGPGTMLDTVPTASLDVSAATNIYLYSNTGSITVTDADSQIPGVQLIIPAPPDDTWAVYVTVAFNALESTGDTGNSGWQSRLVVSQTGVSSVNGSIYFYGQAGVAPPTEQPTVYTTLTLTTPLVSGAGIGIIVDFQTFSTGYTVSCSDIYLQAQLIKR